MFLHEDSRYHISTAFVGGVYGTPMRIFGRGEWEPLKPAAHNECKYVRNSTLFCDDGANAALYEALGLAEIK